LKGVQEGEARRERSRTEHPIHLKRTQGEIRRSQSFDQGTDTIPCRVVLNDFSPEGINVFSDRPLAIGQSISLTIEDPKRLYFRGHVAWCKNISSHHTVISPVRYEYRVAIRFDFATPKEKHAMRVLYFDLLKNYLSRAG